MFCTECGTELPDNAKFCSSCGLAQNSQIVKPSLSSPQSLPKTLTKEVTYEYCEIVYAGKLPDSLLGCLWVIIKMFIPATEPFKETHLQFWAKAIGPKGQYNAGETIWLSGEYADSRNREHSFQQKELVNRLTADGWEATGSGEWWYNIKFRRKIEDLENYVIKEKSQGLRHIEPTMITKTTKKKKSRMTRKMIQERRMEKKKLINEDSLELEIDVTAHQLVVYGKPTVQSDILYTVDNIKLVVGLERDSKGKWVFIENPDDTNIKGWVKSSDLDVQFIDIEDLPVL